MLEGIGRVMGQASRRAVPLGWAAITPPTRGGSWPGKPTIEHGMLGELALPTWVSKKEPVWVLEKEATTIPPPPGELVPSPGDLAFSQPGKTEIGAIMPGEFALPKWVSKNEPVCVLVKEATIPPSRGGIGTTGHITGGIF